MNLEQQVCSFDLAKRLKELGVKQESVFYYQCWREDEKPALNFGKTFSHGEVINVAAFTVAELGEKLLPLIPVPKRGRWNTPSPKNQNIVNLGRIGVMTEADARANMLIYLLANGLLAK